MNIVIPTDLTPEAALQQATEWEQAADELRLQTWERCLQPFFAAITEIMMATEGFIAFAPLPPFYLGFNYQGQLYYLCAYPSANDLDLQSVEQRGEVIGNWALQTVALPSAITPKRLQDLVGDIVEAING